MLNEELYDMDLMEAEVDAECYIGEEILRAGHAPILPLANSVGMEESDMFVGCEFVAADIVIIKNQDPIHSCIVMRQGWRNDSVGAFGERRAALDQDWMIIDLDIMSMDEFRSEMARIMKFSGPCVMYVSGKYRHLKKLPESSDSACSETSSSVE